VVFMVSEVTSTKAGERPSRYHSSCRCASKRKKLENVEKICLDFFELDFSMFLQLDL
jgi:hypothetical protein